MHQDVEWLVPPEVAVLSGCDENAVRQSWDQRKLSSVSFTSFTGLTGLAGALGPTFGNLLVGGDRTIPCPRCTVNV